MPKNKKKTSKSKAKIKKSNKKNYKVRNWSEYNRSLVNRGRLQVWVDEYTLEHWQAEPTGKPGAQPVYSDLAVEITLQFGQVFSQRLRQTEGLVNSIFELMGVENKVPDYSTLSRRGETISVSLPKDLSKDNIVLVADSSGLKVYGEGEWKVRKHGWSKHRIWRKMHFTITPDGEIRGAELTGNNVSDDAVGQELIEHEDADIDAFAGDGAYDTKKIYDKCAEKQINRVLVPPQENAKIWQHGNCHAPPHKRDENLRCIRKTSRKKWKEKVGYHVRSLSENTMFRYKTIFGDKINARKFRRQRTEFLIKASILNKMMTLGMPDSYVIT
jgi:Transposase DDE domain